MENYNNDPAAENAGNEWEKMAAEVLGDQVEMMGDQGEPAAEQVEATPEQTQNLGEAVLATYGENIEKTETDRQVDDLEVLMSFCDEKEVLEILRSDSYGVLLKNEVSLADLFNADALFNEQYYDDGYTRDYEWRYREWGGDKLQSKTTDRDLHLDNNEYLFADAMRAREAVETINVIARDYFGKYGNETKAAGFKDALATRAAGEELSEEQRDFLSTEDNVVADRLLWGPQNTSEARAEKIEKGLDKAIAEYNERKEQGRDDEYAAGSLVTGLIYAMGAQADFMKAGMPNNVADVRKKIGAVVDENFEAIAKFRTGELSDDYDENAIEDLIVEFSDPLKLLHRCAEYNLVENGLIRNPERVVDNFAEEFNPYKGDRIELTQSLSWEAENLARMGVADWITLGWCHDFAPIDFVDKNTVDGPAARFLAAGYDKQEILQKTFSSRNPYDFNRDPLHKYKNPRTGEEITWMEAMEQSGLTPTEAAETFSPDDLSPRLEELLDRGVDAKDLTKYMLSYRETFMKNIHGDTVHKVWWDGVQKIRVQDKNRPEGIVVEKLGMHGSGKDYVTLNLDILADHGVTAEDIIDNLGENDSSPFGHMLPRMIESGKFSTQKVMTLGYEQYKKNLAEMQEVGIYDAEYVEFASNPQRYFATLAEQLGPVWKEQRDRYYNALRESKAGE